MEDRIEDHMTDDEIKHREDCREKELEVRYMHI